MAGSAVCLLVDSILKYAVRCSRLGGGAVRCLKRALMMAGVEIVCDTIWNGIRCVAVG